MGIYRLPNGLVIGAALRTAHATARPMRCSVRCPQRTVVRGQKSAEDSGHYNRRRFCHANVDARASHARAGLAFRRIQKQLGAAGKRLQSGASSLRTHE